MIPYEFHLTVQANDIEEFKRDCQLLNMKPVVLELQEALSGRVFQDVQTTSRFNLPNDDAAFLKMMELSKDLSTLKYDVNRMKIETVPWHEKAPKAITDNPPEGCYFESHLRVLTNPETHELLAGIAKGCKAHLSRNIFKRVDDFYYKMMVTKRNYVGNNSQFATEVDFLKQFLIKENFQVDKLEVEFVLFDSNIKHDSLWLGEWLGE